MLVFKPPVIAHRGVSGLAPENTFAAFEKVVDFNIKWFEFDVMLTADHEAIIFHDESLKRTTNGKGSIKNYNWEFLQSLDAGSWFDALYKFEKIPRLFDVLEFIKTKKLYANIELKPLTGQDVSVVEKTVKIVKNFDLKLDRLLFSSFSLISLRHLQTIFPECQRGLLLHRKLKNWQKIAEELGCISIHVNRHILTQKWAQEIKSLNKTLLSYTVNDVHLAKTLFSWGVDAVFSDYPQKIASAGL